MSENKIELDEIFSALSDGETSDWEFRRALKELDNDPSYRQKWSSYQQIGAALRREPTMGVDISAAVSQAIEQEAAPSKLAPFIAPLKQLGIAASVAVVSLVGFQQYQLAQDQAPGVDNIAEVEEPVEAFQGSQSPAGFEFTQETTVVSDTNSQPVFRPGVEQKLPIDREQLQAHLEEVVEEHSEAAASNSQAVMPMVRVPNKSEEE